MAGHPAASTDEILPAGARVLPFRSDIVPRYLGLRLVTAKFYARIHWQNLVNFGVLATEFADPAVLEAEGFSAWAPPAPGRLAAGLAGLDVIAGRILGRATVDLLQMYSRS